MDNPQKNVVLDLSKHTQLVARVFSGDEWGRYTREKAGLARYDQDPHTTVSIVIPMDTLCLSSSFIRGMLEPSVRALGDKCLSKYQVVARTEKTKYFKRVIETEMVELLQAPADLQRSSGRRRVATDDGVVKRGGTHAGDNSSSWY